MLTAIVGGIAAQQSSLATRVATGIPAGATVLPDLKALDQHIGDTRTAELNPTMRVVAQMQGTSSEFIAVSHYEGCAGVIDGANYAVQTPLMTSVMYDDYKRPVAGSAAQGQDLYAKQTTPGNALVTGTKNTGKVAFLSGLFAGDGAAVDPYGTFAFVDPVTGKSYPANSKPDKVQQQPRVRAVIGDGLKFGASAGHANVGRPIVVDLADKMGLQFVDDGNGGKAVAAWPDGTTLDFNDTGQLESLLGKGGNGSEHFKAGDAIWFLPGPPPTAAPTLTPQAGSGLALDTSYDYAYAVMTARGDTALSPVASITTDATNRTVKIDIVALPAGTIGSGIRVVRRVSARAASGPNPASDAGTWKTVQALTGSLASPFNLVDTTPSTALGPAYTESPTTINVKLYAQQTAPYSASVAIPGSTPPLYPLNGLTIGDTTSGGGNNNGLGVNAKYGNTIDAENYLDTLFAATAAIRNGWGKQLQTMKGQTSQKYNVSGWKFGGDSGFGGRLNLAAYQTPDRTGLLAPIITDAVTPLQDAEGTKTMVSGMIVNEGDDQSSLAVDIAVNALGHPLGLKKGQGVNGNGVAAFPDMGTIDYRASDGALEAIGLNNPPAPPPVTPPPVVTTNPPGTVCDPASTSPDGTITQTCTTTVLEPPPPGSGTQDPTTHETTNGGPDGTVPTSHPAACTPVPGYDSSGTATVIRATNPNWTIGLDSISTIGDANSLTIIGASDPRHDSSIDLSAYGFSAVSGAFGDCWIEGRMSIHNFAAFHGTSYMGFGDHTEGSNFHLVGLAYNDVTTIASPVWTDQVNRGVHAPLPIQMGEPIYWALFASSCSFNGPVYAFFGNEPNVYQFVKQLDGNEGGIIDRFTVWSDTFLSTGDSSLTWTVNRLASGIPNDVKLIDWNGGIQQGSAWTPPTVPVSTTTTTITPPSTVNGNLNVDGGIYVRGNPLAGIVTAVDISAPFAPVPDSFMRIVDPFTGVTYVSPVSMYPNSQPGPASGGYLWPGA